MSNERQILVRVQSFMNYHHPDIPRQLPEVARTEYSLLRDVINLHLEQPEPKPEPAKKVAKKKKVSKKK